MKKSTPVTALGKENSLKQVLQNPFIWRGKSNDAGKQPGLKSGFAELDKLLACAGGGWPVGALTEILPTHEGIGELRLVMPALAALSRQNLWQIWINPPYVPYAPGLVAQQIDVSKLLLLYASGTNDYLWVLEQVLRSEICGAVLTWPQAIRTSHLRRLQLAAESGQTWCICYYAPNKVPKNSPSALRLQLSPSPGGMNIHIQKRRGGWPVGPVFIQL